MAISIRVKESGGSSKLLSTCFSHCWMTNELWKIPNACGSIGLLHSLLNLPERGPDALNPDSKLAQFKAESLPLSGTLFCHLMFLRVGRYLTTVQLRRSRKGEALGRNHIFHCGSHKCCSNRAVCRSHRP